MKALKLFRHHFRNCLEIQKQYGLTTDIRKGGSNLDVPPGGNTFPTNYLAPHLPY